VNCVVDRVQDLGHVELSYHCTFVSRIMINQTSGFYFIVFFVPNEKFVVWFFFFSSPLLLLETLCSFLPSRFCFFFPLLSCYARLFVPSSHLVFIFIFFPVLLREILWSFFPPRFHFFLLSCLATRYSLFLLPVSFSFFFCSPFLLCKTLCSFFPSRFRLFFFLSCLAMRDSLFLLPVSFSFFFFPLLSCYSRIFVSSSCLVFFYLFPSSFFDLKYLFVIISPSFVFSCLVTFSIYTTDSAVECPVS
jgi:hypothetical protein